MKLPLLNQVGVPPFGLASPRFNERPVDLSIHGTRWAHAPFFRELGKIACPKERAAYFQGYMSVVFHLHAWDSEESPHGRMSLKRSYLRFLLGWMFDANSTYGAVMKSWVASRFGLPPTYHGGPIADYGDPSHLRYLQDRALGLADTNAIEQQFDLLYEFTQDELRRAGVPEQLLLHRGVYGLEEHRVVEEMGEGRCRMWLNNLNSFTRDFERAWEFGDRVLEVRVPRCKVVFDGALLHGGVLEGEEEVLVLGGCYDVRIRKF